MFQASRAQGRFRPNKLRRRRGAMGSSSASFAAWDISWGFAPGILFTCSRPARVLRNCRYGHKMVANMEKCPCRAKLTPATVGQDSNPSVRKLPSARNQIKFWKPILHSSAISFCSISMRGKPNMCYLRTQSAVEFLARLRISRESSCVKPLRKVNWPRELILCEYIESVKEEDVMKMTSQTPTSSERIL